MRPHPCLLRKTRLPGSGDRIRQNTPNLGKPILLQKVIQVKLESVLEPCRSDLSLSSGGTAHDDERAAQPL